MNKYMSDLTKKNPKNKKKKNIVNDSLWDVL